MYFCNSKAHYNLNFLRTLRLISSCMIGHDSMRHCCIQEYLTIDWSIESITLRLKAVISLRSHNLRFVCLAEEDF